MKNQDLIKHNEYLSDDISEFINIEINLRNRLLDAIHQMLADMGGEYVFDVEEDNDLYICYDGGNHIEYASNMSERVEAIKVSEYMGRASFKVNVREEHNIDQSRLLFEDVIAIYELLSAVYADQE